MKQYAIIRTDSIYHPGDERSRTHPGHGYPAYTESVKVIKTFDSKEQWEKYIRDNELSNYPDKITPIIYSVATVSKDISISIE